MLDTLCLGARLFSVYLPATIIKLGQGLHAGRYLMSLPAEETMSTCVDQVSDTTTRRFQSITPEYLQNFVDAKFRGIIAPIDHNLFCILSF